MNEKLHDNATGNDLSTPDGLTVAELRRELQLARRRIDLLERRQRLAPEPFTGVRRTAAEAELRNVPFGPAIPRPDTRPIIAESPFRVMLEQIGEGALTLQLSGLITYCNSRFAEMLQLAPEQITGRDLRDFLPVADHARFATLLRSGVDGTVRAEFVLGAATSSSMPIEMSLSPLRRYATDPLICAVTADLTDRKQQDYALHETMGRLEAESAQRLIVEEALRQSQKMEAIGQLTGGLAHDFNNLLTAILGAIEQMQKQMQAGRTDRLETYLTAAREASERAAALTNRLLAFARRQPLRPSQICPATLAEGMLDMIRRSVGPTIEVTFDASPLDALTICDANQLENALLNLAINARDAMPSGGRLHLSVHAAPLAPDEAALHDLTPGPYLRIDVTDNGEGMTPEIAARAFDPFFTTKPVGQGTGLGLSTINVFVRESGGQASIVSTPGLGTTITLFLPEIMPT